MGNGDGLLDFRKRTKIWELSVKLLKGKGEGGRQGWKGNNDFSSLEVAVSLVLRAGQMCPGMFNVRLYPPPCQASKASSSSSSYSVFFPRHQRFHSGFLQPRKSKNCTEGHLQSVVRSLRLNTLWTDLKHFIIPRISVTISHSISIQSYQQQCCCSLMVLTLHSRHPVWHIRSIWAIFIKEILT